MNNNQLPWQQENIIRHSQRLLQSFQHWTGRSLIDLSGSTFEQAQGLFEADFALVSHGTEADPIFNYANQIALEVWQMTWDDFTQLPSRLSAEPVEQRERDRLLVETRNKGFSHYQGVRISRIGNRFFIKDGIIWNVLDEDHKICGQAAVFSDYTPV
ncbi:MAG TPA: MEKHLA domain-containing protein [Oculatellaceae cyanobacterium]|jgi:hypothetical protein